MTKAGTRVGTALARLSFSIRLNLTVLPARGALAVHTNDTRLYGLRSSNK